MTDLNAVQPEPIGDMPTKDALAEIAALSVADEKYQDTIVRSEMQKIQLRWIGTVTAIGGLVLLAALEGFLVCHLLKGELGTASVESVTLLAFAPITAFTVVLTVFLFGVFRPPPTKDLKKLPVGPLTRFSANPLSE